ncbi:MAG: glycosyltransferase family 4 protein [Pseudomonadota bacterium]
MRVAIVLPRGFAFDAAKPNSIETVVRTLNAEVLQAPLGAQVTIIADASDVDNGPFELRYVPKGLGRARRVRAILAQFDEMKPDLVEVHQDPHTAARLADLVSPQRGGPSPVLLYRHNQVKPPANVLRRFVMRGRYGRPDALVFVSKAMKAAFETDYPEIGVPTFAVPNAIDVKPWLAPLDSKERLIVFAGRAAREKGFKELCAAVPVVLDAFSDWRFEACALAWDRWSDWASASVKPLERFPDDRVIIHRDQPLGFVQELLKRASIAIVPSTFDEPFGLAAVEAHAAGAAVISSGRGGLREASGDWAVYLDDVTPEAIAKALCDLITDDHKRRHLAEEGQSWVREAHAVDVRAAELHRVRSTTVIAI